MNLRENVSLSIYTTFRIGGNARFFAEAKSDEDFRGAFLEAKKRKFPFLFSVVDQTF